MINQNDQQEENISFCSQLAAFIVQTSSASRINVIIIIIIFNHSNYLSLNSAFMHKHEIKQSNFREVVSKRLKPLAFITQVMTHHLRITAI